MVENRCELIVTAARPSLPALSALAIRWDSLASQTRIWGFFRVMYRIDLTAHTSYCTDWLLTVCTDTNTTNSRKTHASASSSVHPLCTTDCLQQVGLGVPPEHHLSLHLPTSCLLRGRGWEKGSVITPSRYLQPPAVGDPTNRTVAQCVQSWSIQSFFFCKYRTANTHLCTMNQIVCSVNIATHQ